MSMGGMAAALTVLVQAKGVDHVNQELKMARAPKVCATLSCPELAPSGQSYCTQHSPKPWATSTRRSRTISGGAQQKRAARIMRQYERTCHVCGKPMADEVDHVVPLAEGGADDDSNLRPIHSRPCHQAKSSAEATRVRRSRV